MAKSLNKPTLQKELLVSIQEFNTDKISTYVINNKLENQLLIYCFDKDELLSSRSTWVLWFCYEKNKKILLKFQDKLIQNLNKTNLHNGVIRNTLRLFQNEPIPEKYESFMLDKCYSYIKNAGEAIAVRAFAMTVVFNISKPYPELLNELKSVLIHVNHPDESPGVKSKVKNTLKDIDKVLNK